MEKQHSLELKSIGIIHSPYHSRREAPRQGCGREEICQVEVFKDFEEGLKGIEGFSHIILIYWFHRSPGYSFIVKSRGVFTTRSPDRPSPLGLSVVELVAREGNILKIKGLDALDGSPLLDIKPYIPTVDEKSSYQS
ncbi:MAG: tRNA (N6-threonylcarbamoyladenosine(37)-N6)-methyltransferase TrmO [Dehalococcoidia bacterium]|nr:tRNA (N6-threonylcarbamoyladenosine(37)-N6)-methyltransferase TrmO [Dehalococcoidia bacterium]